jgi:hypothetical protein
MTSGVSADDNVSPAKTPAKSTSKAARGKKGAANGEEKKTTVDSAETVDEVNTSTNAEKGSEEVQKKEATDGDGV